MWSVGLYSCEEMKLRAQQNRSQNPNPILPLPNHQWLKSHVLRQKGGKTGLGNKTNKKQNATAFSLNCVNISELINNESPN